MKSPRVALTCIAMMAATAPAFSAETTDRNISVPDAVPACMERNGPDCLLKSDIVAPRVLAPAVSVIPPVPTTSPADTSGNISTAPRPPATGLVGSPPTPPSTNANVTTTTTPSGTLIVTPNPSATSTSRGFTTNPNSIGGNLQSSGGTSGPSTSSGVTTNPNSVGGNLTSGPAATPATATTGGGSVRR